MKRSDLIRGSFKEACKLFNGCETGQAVLTEGFDLPAAYIVHTVGPVWQGGTQSEASLLASCYKM
jgi:O-acetyl-ADP-ribose deacetylase (regulator of RNase III)